MVSCRYSSRGKDAVPPSIFPSQIKWEANPRAFPKNQSYPLSSSVKFARFDQPGWVGGNKKQEVILTNTESDHPAISGCGCKLVVVQKSELSSSISYLY
jgi:hypothetical protein